MKYHLAQINIGKLLAPIDHPLIAGFVNQLDRINALAEKSPGFVWRLQEENGSAVNIQVFEDPLLLVNMSVWESADALKAFTYQTDHLQVFRDRYKWFEKPDRPHLALWWIPAGQLPTPEVGKTKLEYLQGHGETEVAFTFRSILKPSQG